MSLGIVVSPACHEQIEAQANFGAGRLLFFQDQLRDFISLSMPNFALVKAIKTHYGKPTTTAGYLHRVNKAQMAAQAKYLEAIKITSTAV